MKAISSYQSSLFLNAATSAGPLTSAWELPFPTQARCSEAAVSRRSLRRREPEVSEWQEVTVRIALTVSILGAYAAVFWQISGF